MSKIVFKTSRVSFISLYTFSALLVILFFLLGLNIISPYVNLAFTLVILLIITHPEWYIFYYTFIVDKDRVIQISGFLDKKKIVVPITSIAAVTLDKSFFGRILNYGDLHVVAFADKKVILRGIRKPDELVERLEAMMEKYRHEEKK